MASTPTDHSRLEQQGLGENLNTWGDDKLNRALRKIDQAMKNVVSITLTGDHTLTTALYEETSDEAANAVLKLGGSLSNPASLVVPSVRYWYVVDNGAGRDVTVKTAAGAGVTVPSSSAALVYCDGTDVRNGAPTTFGGRRLSDIGLPQAGTDAATKGYVDTAIASAAIPATPGTVLVSGADTTAAYLATALTAGTGITLTVLNPGGDETLQVTSTVTGFSTYASDADLFGAVVALGL